jgi:hypothetical protein
MATASKLPPIPPLFKADTAAFEPEVSWCPEQRKNVGRHMVCSLAAIPIATGYERQIQHEATSKAISWLV